MPALLWAFAPNWITFGALGAERPREGEVTGGEEARFLLCRLGSCVGAIPIRDVRETMRTLPVQPLRGVPPFVLGLAMIRGQPTPVIDATRLLSPAVEGASAADPTLDRELWEGSPASARRFVTLRVGERTVALALDAVIDVRSLPAETLKDAPPLLRSAGGEIVSVVGALDAQLLLVLEAGRLVPESLLSALAQERAFG